MSNGNNMFSRGENPLGMFVQHNVLRTDQRLNPQRCRRRMRTEQQGLPTNGVAISGANSLLRPLTVPTKKCQTTTIIHRREIDAATMARYASECFGALLAGLRYWRFAAQSACIG